MTRSFALLVCAALAVGGAFPADTVGESPGIAATNGVAANAGEVCPVSTNFNLAAGVIWKKFRKVKDKYVLGQPAEGNAVALFKMSLRSKNAELAAEAQTILDAIAETRDVLGERLEKAQAEGRPGVEEWIRLYLRSFPSRRARFARSARRRRGKRIRPAATALD